MPLQKSSLLTDAAIDALVRLHELLPGMTYRELIEAAVVEMVRLVEMYAVVEMAEVVAKTGE